MWFDCPKLNEQQHYRPIGFGVLAARMGNYNCRRLSPHHSHSLRLSSVWASLRLQESRGAEVLDWSHPNGSLLFHRICKSLPSTSHNHLFFFSVNILSTHSHPLFQIFHQFVSLVNPSISVDCEILRDCYESFAMYCFGRYLVACLGGEERTLQFMERQGRAALSLKTPLLLHSSSDRGTVKHPFPLNYFLKPWTLGRRFYQIVKFGIVQYVRFYVSPTLSSFVIFFLLNLSYPCWFVPYRW